MSDPQLPNGGHPQVISEDKAKQGRRGLHVLMILVVSATLAALALFAVWMTRSQDLAAAESSEINHPSEAAIVDQPVDYVREDATQTDAAPANAPEQQGQHTDAQVNTRDPG